VVRDQTTVNEVLPSCAAHAGNPAYADLSAVHTLYVRRSIGCVSRERVEQPGLGEDTQPQCQENSKSALLSSISLDAQSCLMP